MQWLALRHNQVSAEGVESLCAVGVALGAISLQSSDDAEESRD